MVDSVRHISQDPVAELSLLANLELIVDKGEAHKHHKETNFDAMPDC